ncbi:MAG: hypothetical protein R3310_11435 [Candidatus Competibacteraceae bacterium]|nr:hypothetical protein [Candidatus Competibacteraceae bacterium]
MLNRIEQKLTSMLGDELAARSHLSVTNSPTAVAGLDPGRGTVLVALSGLTPAARFERGTIAFEGLQSRRILPMQFMVRVELFIRAAGNSEAQLIAARNLLLEDLSLISHGLAHEGVVGGKAFAVSDPDPGFKVISFALEEGTINRDADEQLLSGVLRYRGGAEIWPPGTLQPVGEIRTVDTTLVPLPLEITLDSRVVRSGESAILRVRSLPTVRLAALEPRVDQSLRLAVSVLSDSPPAQRGTISGATAGQESGLGLVEVAQPETLITYQAPQDGIDRLRIEYVVIHLATPDNHRGIFLGSTAIRLEPSP